MVLDVQEIGKKSYLGMTLLFLAAALAGCTTAPPTSTSISKAPGAASTKIDVGLAAFRDICLATAPSFVSGYAAAKKYGVEGSTEFGGITGDGSLSVQIKPGKECAVTTETRPGPIVHAQFLQTVANVAATPSGIKGGQTPFNANVGGNNFIFQHDRNGGEAYVMIKLGS